MPRRRNLSTEISDDRELNNLAATAGDFAALLFTWAIPHAQDDRSLPGEPDDLLFLVVPRRRDKTPEDAEAAIRAWVAAKLVDWVWVDGKRRIYYKADSFYRIQDKVPQARRFYGVPDESTPVVPEPASLQDAADSPQRAAVAAETPPNAASAADVPLARALPAGGPGSDPLLSPSDVPGVPGAIAPSTPSSPAGDGGDAAAAAEGDAHRPERGEFSDWLREFNGYALSKGTRRHPWPETDDLRRMYATRRRQWSYDQLVLAVMNLFADPHKLGANDRGTVYATPEFILRNDRMVARYQEAPVIREPTGPPSSRPVPLRIAGGG